MSDLKIDLSKKEKYFLACFYSGNVDLLNPAYKGWISLYSYLDHTHESLNQQKLFIQNEDEIISESLRKVGSSVDNERTLMRQIKNLKDSGLYVSAEFLRKYRNVAKWFWYEESNIYINKANEKRQLILNKISKVSHDNHIKELKIIDDNYRTAMRKLSTNTFKISAGNEASKYLDDNILSKKTRPIELNQTVSQAIANKKNYMTLQGKNFLKNLSDNLRNEKIELMKKDKYNYGLYSNEIIQIDKRISSIDNPFPHYDVIDPSVNFGSDCVRFGAIVCLKNFSRLIKIKIVGAVEIEFHYEIEKELSEDWDIQYVTWSSPLGESLIGNHIGDMVLAGSTGDLHEIIDVIYPR